MPKFVLEQDATVPVSLQIYDGFLEIVTTHQDKYLVSIDMATGDVTINETPEFGLKYSKSIR